MGEDGGEDRQCGAVAEEGERMGKAQKQAFEIRIFREAADEGQHGKSGPPVQKQQGLHDLSGVGPRPLRLEAIFLIGELRFFEFQPFMVDLALALLQAEAPGLTRRSLSLCESSYLSLQFFVFTSQISLR